MGYGPWTNDELKGGSAMSSPGAANITSVLTETRVFPPPAEFAARARIKSMAEYEKLWQRANDDPQGFWAEQARTLDWFKPWSQVLLWNEPHAQWFVGGKLNVSYNCLDRHLQGPRKNKAAIIWEGEPGDSRVLRYQDLHREVCKFANVLKGLGIRAGDRVTIYMPMVPELAIALLACARIGAPHSIAGYLLGVSLTHQWVFDLREEDTYWCTADIGWVTGHSYIVYGPLCNGATTIMYEGAPNYPREDRFWALIEKYRVNTFYTAPTAIRAFVKWGDHWPKKHDLSSLRLLGTVGEPINPEAWMWYHTLIGNKRCPIVDTWWQTETGMIMISPLPGAIPTKPGSCTRPLPGVVAEVVDKQGRPLPPNHGGLLVIRQPWPAMLRTIYGDDERYRQQYWSQVPHAYFTADGARPDQDGYFWITGRVDDVLNVSGHRLSTMEVESALVHHPQVAEAAGVGKPDAIKGEG